ncbi:MAG: hypothetical protein ACOX58_07045 [Christensenellales bacterium]
MKSSMKLLAFIILIAFALSACTDNGGNNITPDVEPGGKVDRSVDASKVIESKDLTSMEAEFFYAGKDINRSDSERLRFKLERNENSELILSEAYRYGISTKVGDEVLSGAQKLIEKFKLSELSETDIPELPESHSSMFFKAEYASGESIYFKVDGNPKTSWCNELAEYFLSVFEEYGETSVLSP